jgi:hypothetical protein
MLEVLAQLGLLDTLDRLVLVILDLLAQLGLLDTLDQLVLVILVQLVRDIQDLLEQLDPWDILVVPVAEVLVDILDQ